MRNWIIKEKTTKTHTFREIHENKKLSTQNTEFHIIFSDKSRDIFLSEFLTQKCPIVKK